MVCLCCTGKEGLGRLVFAERVTECNREVHKRSLRLPLKMAAARDIVDKELKTYFRQRKSGSVQCRDSCQVRARPGRASPVSALRMCTWKIRLVLVHAGPASLSDFSLCLQLWKEFLEVPACGQEAPGRDGFPSSDSPKPAFSTLYGCIVV